MIRKIIHIDQEKCNGCGLCANACHEGAIEMVNGKATLTREHFCDGMGDCLPACPAGAITFEEREASAYNAAAVEAAKHAKQLRAGGCPGSAAMSMKRPATAAPTAGEEPASQLQQWPCQIKLVPIQAPFFDGADVLVAADCTAFAYANIHQRFMAGKITLVGCPKLDAVDYAEKLSAIFQSNNIRSVTVLRMEVPCCGGIQRAVQNAIARCPEDIPCEVVVISRDGRILNG